MSVCYSKNPAIIAWLRGVGGAKRGKSAADEKSRSLTADGVHACPADFAIIAGLAESESRECDAHAERTLLSRAYAPIARSHCARVGTGPRDRTPYLHSDGRLSSRACITTGRGLQGATLLSSFSRVCVERPVGRRCLHTFESSIIRRSRFAVRFILRRSRKFGEAVRSYRPHENTSYEE